MKMRSRVFSDITTTRSYRDAWLVNHPTQWDRNDLFAQITRRDEMHDVVTPNFFTLRNKGGIICSPMYRENRYVRTDATVVDIGGWKKTDNHAVRRIKPLFNHLDVSVDGLLQMDHVLMDAEFAKYSRETNLALMRAHADVDISEMQLLASLGELPETLAWLESLVTRVVGLTRAFKKKQEVLKVLRTLKSDVQNIGSKTSIRRLEKYQELLLKRKERDKASKAEKSLIDNFSQAWLEYRYALRPLISDIQNALKALDTIITSQRCVARGHEYSTATREKIVTQDDPYQRVTAKIVEGEIIRARAGCLYTIEEQVCSLSTILGLDQPIESLYELLPFSFMIDWVFSIGDLLQSWFKSSGLEILTSWVTLSVESYRDVTCTDFWYYSGDTQFTFWINNVVLGASNLRVVRKWRYSNPALPLLPRFDLKLDLAKIIDIGLIGRAITGGKLTEVTKGALKHA